MRLPAAYVAEHVELGYATSTARSQGITVDETQTIAAPGMAPRGPVRRHESRTGAQPHLHPLDQPRPNCPPGHLTPATARDVLDQILATTHAGATATETWQTYHPDAAPPTPATSARALRTGTHAPAWQPPHQTPGRGYPDPGPVIAG